MKGRSLKRGKPSKRVGRSIEEVLVQRQFDGTDPITWPNGTTFNQFSRSQKSLPNLQFSSSGNDNTPLSRSGQPQRNSRGNFLSEYSDDDKMKMMESLVKYTRALQTRVEDLELQLSGGGNSATPLLSSSAGGMAPLVSIPWANSDNQLPPRHVFAHKTITQSRAAMAADLAAQALNAVGASAFQRSSISRGARGGGESFISVGSNHSSDPFGGPANAARIINDFDEKVTGLKKIFMTDDPLAERRSAATAIGAVVRGFLTRTRLKHYRRGAREWRWIRCRPVTHLLDILLANMSKRDAGFHLLRMNRNMNTIGVFFSAWAYIYRKNLSTRRAVRATAEERIKNKRLQLLRSVFDGLRAASIGRFSTRNANAERRKLIDSIRDELSQELKRKGSLGVVLEVEVTRVLHRRVLDQFFEKKRRLALLAIFNGIVGQVKKSKSNWKQAVAHHFRVLAGRCFYEWSNFIYLTAVGLDKKRWPGPRKYEVRYNQKKVDNFARVRCLRVVYSAWKEYFGIQYKVKRSYQLKIAELVQSVFHGWVQVARHQNKLRRKTYENWIEYPRVMVHKPFYLWSAYVKGQKNRHNEQLRIAKSYVRWKWRQKILVIMKRWRHQALFGRIEGLYTRQMLLKTLGEQKLFANTLEKAMADQTVELDECRHLITKEIEKRRALEEELTLATAEQNRYKMRIHHFEQELRRVESIVEAIMELNPSLLVHIETKQNEFKFKERNIDLPPAKNSKKKPRPKKDSVVSAAEEAADKLGLRDTEQSPDDISLLSNDLEDDASGGDAEDLAAENVDDADGNEAADKIGVSLQSQDAMDKHEEHDSSHGDIGMARGISEIVAEGRKDAHSLNEEECPPMRKPSFILTDAKASKPKVHRRGCASGMTAKLHAVEERLKHQGDTTENVDDSAPKNPPLPPEPPVSEEDRQLLDRVKWILNQYRDAKKKEEEIKHYKTSLELVDYPIMKELPAGAAGSGGDDGEDESSIQSKGKKDYGVSDNDSVSVSTAINLPMKTRPTLLPEPAECSLSSVVRKEEQEKKIGGALSTGATASPGITAPASPGQPHHPGALSGITSSNPSLSREPSQRPPTGPCRQGSRVFTARRHDSDASAYLEEIYDLPTQQAEELDSLKTAAVKILLSFVEFIDSGNITSFQPNDKRLWAQHLLEKAKEHKTAVACALAEEAAATADLPPPELPDQVPKAAESGSNLEVTTTERPLTPPAPSLQRETTMVRLDSTSALLGVDHPQDGATSWRNKLLQLRTLYPNAGNTSGKGSNIDEENEISMFTRILKMRFDLEDIITQQTAKYQKHLHKMIHDENGLQSTRSSIYINPSASFDNVAPLGRNIYAGNLAQITKDEGTAVAAYAAPSAAALRAQESVENYYEQQLESPSMDSTYSDGMSGKLSGPSSRQETPHRKVRINL